MEVSEDVSGEPWLGIDVEDITPTQPTFYPMRTPGPQLLGGVNYSILDLFHHFISKTMLQGIVRNSNKYGEKRHRQAWQAISLEDMYSYIAIVIYMGLVEVKNIRDYWKKSDLYNFPFPASVISGRKFVAISRSLHLSSPDDDEANDKRKGTDDYDRLCKVKPMYSQIREMCRAYFHPRQHISIKERMVKARLNLRQYMKDKPTKCGYKLFVLADSSTGYIWDFFIYEGKGAPIVKRLSYDTVMNLVDVPVLGRGYKLYIDDFYTSPALFLDLLDKKVLACGTIREQRIGFPRDRPGGLDSKSPRGTIRWIREGPLVFVQWRDTRDVSICSTIHPAHSDNTVQRKVKADGHWVEQAIPAPPGVSDYNKHMGGIDLSDAMIGYYNALHKTRKWYRTFFYHFVDIGIVNAFILHQELAKEKQQFPLTQKEFREALMLELKAAGSPSTAPRQAPPRAPSGAPHKLRHFTADGNVGRRRCVHCSMKTTVECTSCSVALCFTVSRDCYNEWHNINLNVWIIGDSYVRRGAERAAETMGDNLGHDNLFVQWFGWGGLRWKSLVPFFRRSLQGRAVPDVLLIHCGGNDLGSVKSVGLVAAMKEDLRRLHLQYPDMTILFSELTQRCRWRAGDKPAKLDKARSPDQ
ncbi:piggyBac transposable element-derived protein 4-like [Scomber japonicus]|uniref:piggyBac transposable element-derived protein 4-like n=1 Tax=Scomber japonicus TaxID=13676 RepID=UPI002305DF37|nr:piggyBac transposable element-derived protein 4-like [Scomber japonicus]